MQNFTYGPDGLVETISDKSGLTTEIDTVLLGTTDEYYHTVTTTPDNLSFEKHINYFGSPSKLVDIYGDVTRFEYDAKYRLKGIWKNLPLGGIDNDYAVAIYSYTSYLSPGWGTMWSASGKFINFYDEDVNEWRYIYQNKIVDSLGRPRQEKRSAEILGSPRLLVTGQRTIQARGGGITKLTNPTHVLYSFLNLNAFETSYGYDETIFSKNRYDEFGRLETVELPNGYFANYDYGKTIEPTSGIGSLVYFDSMSVEGSDGAEQTQKSELHKDPENSNICDRRRPELPE